MFKMTRISAVLFFFLISITPAWSQGVGIPSKKGGIGFGNLPHFTGIRLNFIDRNVEKITGVNVTVWNVKNSDEQTGIMRGIAVGLPMAMGVETQNGISVGVFGVGAKKNLSGINIGGLGVGAGGSVSGLNIGGLGIGAGENLRGINLALLGVGSGGKVSGFNFGGLGVGAGGDLSGINIGGLGVGSGGNLSGVNIGGIGVGSGGNVTGLNIAAVGLGAGGRMRGLNIAGIGLGSGESLEGISIACVAAGSPAVTGLAIAPVVGGLKVKGIIIAPAWMRVGGDKPKKKDVADSSYVANVQEGEFTGISVSAFNRVLGTQKGVSLGVVNYTKRIRGVQFGLINIVRENPRGLRVLPVFNTRMGRK